MRGAAWLALAAAWMAGSVPAGAQPGPPPSSSPPPLCGSFNLDPSAPPPPPNQPCTPGPADAGTWSGQVGTFGLPSTPSGPAPAPGPLQIGIIGGDAQYGADLADGVANRLGLVANVGRSARAGDRWRVRFLFQNPYSAQLVTAMVFEEACGSNNGRYCNKRAAVWTCSVQAMPQCVDNTVSWIQATAAAP